MHEYRHINAIQGESNFKRFQAKLRDIKSIKHDIIETKMHVRSPIKEGQNIQVNHTASIKNPKGSEIPWFVLNRIYS